MRGKHSAPGRPVFLLFWCAVLACILALPAFAAGENTGAWTVGVPTDRCPIFYRDADTGEIVGIGTDLMRFAAEEAGFSVTFEAVEASPKAALDDPGYDFVLPFGSSIDSASGLPTAVSDNLFQTPFTLVTAGKRDIPSLNSLHVGMLRSLGGAAETVRQLYPGMKVDMYETMDDCVRALRSGAVDALLHNSYVWSYVLQKPSYSDLRVQPSAMFSMDFRAGTPDTPEGRERIEALNRGIAGLDDTRIQAVILDYTSRSLYRNDLSDYLYENGLKWLLLVLLLAALAVIVLQRIRTIRKKQEEKLNKLIDYDPLTGVYSKEGFRKRVEELLRAFPDTPYVLAYTNIRNFKYINDSLGKAAGDELLRFWAQKTLAMLSDREAIGRLAGDRFTVLRFAGGDEKLIQDDREVIDSVRSYFVDRGKGNRIQVCGGVYVLTPEDYRNIDVDHMLDCARVAERRVLETRHDGYEMYNPDQWEKGKRTAEIISHLGEALKNGDIRVWYQPQVRYDTGEISGAEALCRWNHVRLGPVSPAEFIPVLEEAGLIYELDCFVWNTVCGDLREWNRKGLHPSVSVNLSRCDIREDHHIPDHFRQLVQDYGLTPDQLRIEITETAYVENPDLLIRTTEQLRSFGFQVEMDDFGSGYSSLHMLKELPVDMVKLDLYFLTETGDQERGRTIIRSMIQMGQSLGMKILAEGVETEAQARFLLDAGCREMQGFYFYHPITEQDFEDVLTHNHSV